MCTRAQHRDANCHYRLADEATAKPRSAGYSSYDFAKQISSDVPIVLGKWSGLNIKNVYIGLLMD